MDSEYFAGLENHFRERSEPAAGDRKPAGGNF
jgi:hypothetical protein